MNWTTNLITRLLNKPYLQLLLVVCQFVPGCQAAAAVEPGRGGEQSRVMRLNQQCVVGLFTSVVELPFNLCMSKRVRASSLPAHDSRQLRQSKVSHLVWKWC